MNFKTKKNKDILEVEVTLPREKLGNRLRIVYPTEVYSLIKSEYNVVSYLKKPRLQASYEEDASALFTFLLKEEKKSDKPRNKRVNKKKVEREEEEVEDPSSS